MRLNSDDSTTPDRGETQTCEDHDWQFKDDSFDHEFGTERVHYFECTNCGATREAEPADYEFDD